jgi:membrane protein involved in colicin uptake
MKNNLKVILLICAAIAIFVLGVIFGFFVSPNRYKIESNGRIKLDTITGRVWIYNSEKHAYLGEKQMQAAEAERLEKEKQMQAEAEQERLERVKQMRAAEAERLEKEKQMQAEAEQERLERVKQMQAAEAERLEKEKRGREQAGRQVAEWEKWQEAKKRLVIGMTKAEVRSICGEPESISAGSSIETWTYSHGMVIFQDGKLNSY